MVVMKKASSYILLFFLSVQIVFAQVNSNDFNIQVYIGGADVVAPSTPVLLSVVPVASSQINVTWLASTDDYSVAGYVVERDGLSVATTTLLNYSDAGLLASTTYNYTVRAFDLAFNYSSSSNNISTTTPDVVVPTPTPTTTPVSNTNPTQGTITKVVLESFLIQENISTTSINLTTVFPSRIEVRWGKTGSYELGYVVNEIYNKQHSILLTELEPGTKYNYEIIGYTPHGNQTVLKSGWFQTLDKIKTNSPANVNRFQAQVNGGDVALSWQLPVSKDFSYVRIVRSYFGFPDHPQAGAVVYQGDGTAFVDRDILNQYPLVYYTAFVYDIFGNVSSGAVALAHIRSGTDKPLLPLNNSSTDNQVSDNGYPKPSLDLPVVIPEATSSIAVERVTVDMKMPQPTEIVVKQADQIYTMLDNGINLINDQSFVVSIPYSSMAGNLKSIIVTILDPTDNRQAYSYLLRINKDQTAYEATIAPMSVAGNSQIKISIYDYEAFVVATYQTPIQFVLPVIDPTQSVMFPDILYKYSIPSLIILGIIFILLLIFFIFKRRHEDNR